MRDKKIKLIYFSTHGSEVKSVNLTWKRILSVMFSSFVVMLLLVGSSIALFTDAYHNVRIASLSKTNQILNSQLQLLNNKVAEIETQMQAVERSDDVMRIKNGLPRLDEDLRRVGTGGGGEENPELNGLPSDLQSQTKQISLAVSALARRLKLHEENIAEVSAKMRKDSVMYKHIPSIRPVLDRDGHVTDKFGMRIDPFIERAKHHNGIDISAETGTEVYAAAAGRVEKAENVYTPWSGYGKYIVIDHGNGYKTLYGHLSQVHVKVGQQVDRWKVIGLVGETGRATGPHLHYEVILNGKSLNPERNMLEGQNY
ncbi:MAG: M23 family metallopeptidase [candidate division KSB1 bacterium]|nr:M23 family metallopeptidase [candidate division KSB1 bacterium]